jgi:hypothetical protein
MKILSSEEEISNSKQKELGCEENGLILRRIDLNPGRNSWKIKRSKERISLVLGSNSKGKNSNLKKNSFILRGKKRKEKE